VSTGKRPHAKEKFSTIILAAGIGKRMYSKTPKILHKILGKPIISFVVEQAQNIKSDEIILVIGKNAKIIKKLIGNKVKYAMQRVPRGTGDATKRGIDISKNSNILILCGDVPLLREATIMKLINHHNETKADLSFLTCQMKNPFGYGRIIRNNKNKVLGIVEQSNATARQRKIREMNAGVYYGKKKSLISALNKIDNKNRQREFYLTDIVREMFRKKKKLDGLKTKNEEEIMGINSKFDLSKARAIVKQNWFKKLLEQGVYIEDPPTTNIDLSVQIGKFVHIRPHTLIEGKTRIKDGMTVGPFVWIKDGKKLKYPQHA
jgi:bifunctional UDP-N-acetylglucosamine pyrophosphorylase/glucosamine-1-phosphate N-acetyltransferase